MTDKRMEEIWALEYSLQDIASADKFKTYDELKTRMEKVLGLNAAPRMPSAEATEESQSIEQPSLPTAEETEVDSDEGELDVEALMARINAEDDDD